MNIGVSIPSPIVEGAINFTAAKDVMTTAECKAHAMMLYTVLSVGLTHTALRELASLLAKDFPE